MSLWKKKNKPTVVQMPKPEQAPPRTLEEIQQIYSALATKAGQAWYHRNCLDGDLSTLNNQMRELNQEAAILKQKQAAEEAAKPAPTAEPEAPSESK